MHEGSMHVTHRERLPDNSSEHTLTAAGYSTCILARGSCSYLWYVKAAKFAGVNPHLSTK